MTWTSTILLMITLWSPFAQQDWGERVDRWITEGAYGEAEQQLRSAQEAQPDDQLLKYHLGRLLAAHAASAEFQSSAPAGLIKTRFAEAAASFEESLEGDVPGDARLRCAESYYWAADGESCSRVLDPMLESDSATGWRLEGDVRGFIGGDWPAALEAYERARSIDPATPGVDLRIADAHAREGNLDEALAALKRRIEREPTDPEVFDRIWRWLVATRGFAQASELYGLALDGQPKNFTALYHLGIVRRLVEDYDAADELLAKALELNPAASEVVYHRALVSYARKDFEEAASRARKVLDVDPGHSGAREILQTVAGWYGSQRDYESALGVFRQLAEAETSSQLEMNIALTLKHLGRSVESEAAYRRAIELDPLAGAPWNDLGILLQSVGRLRDAADCYRRSIATDIDVSNSLENIAVLGLRESEASGVSREEARQALERLLDLEPERSRARFYWERLLRGVEE
ncbi:MAG: tetratricopeptide repeat protein [Planctomycetota bacterium]